MRDTHFNYLQTRNPATFETHRRQVLWQITLPFVIGLLVILAVAVITVIAATRGGEGVSRWADISLIWLILPALAATFLFLVLTAGLAYGVIKLIEVFPVFAYKSQQFLASLRETIRSVSDKSVEPVIKVEGFWAAVRRLFGK